MAWESVSVTEVEQPIVRGDEEVAGTRPRGVECERGDDGGGVEERAEVGGSGEVVEADGVVGVARGGDATDGAQVGW